MAIFLPIYVPRQLFALQKKFGKINHWKTFCVISMTRIMFRIVEEEEVLP